MRKFKKTKVLAAALALSLTLTGCSLSYRLGNLFGNNSTTTEATSEEASVGSEATTEQYNDGDLYSEDVQEKLAAIEQLIDESFYFDYDKSKYEDYLYKGLMESLDDPYSVYYTPEEYAALQEDTSGEYEGIGVRVTQDAETKVITLYKPFKDGPGAKAGVLPGDILTAVDGVSVDGYELDEVVKWIRGEAGSEVTLTITREGETEPMDIVVTRDTVINETVTYEMLDDKIGYVLVSEFNSNTDEMYRQAVDELKAQGMKGMIVDLRDNPGGLVTTVVDMLDYMLPEGKIVYTKNKAGEICEEYNSTDDEQFDLPLVVLVNEYSASASEIYTGAIKDYGLGKIVGTNTYGKGIVQGIVPLSDGSAVKLTIEKYFTPNGNDIHKVGIAPDVEVELDEGLRKLIEIPKDKDNQLQKGIEVLNDEMGK